MFLYSFLVNLTFAANNVSWEYDSPNVVICNTSPTKIENVKKAVIYWKKRGYVFGSIFKETEKQECKSKYNKKHILLVGQKDLDTDEYYGITTPWLNKRTRKIVSATIRLSDIKANKVSLLKHELGHALGLDHSNNPKSIMYTHRKY